MLMQKGPNLGRGIDILARSLVALRFCLVCVRDRGLADAGALYGRLQVP